MLEKRYARVARLILMLTILFVLIAGAGLFVGCRYINNQLLRSDENMALDIALLVKNNFQITDDEVAYMKTLTFNEMEVDPINHRLMDVGDGVELNCEITNVYIVAGLSDDEIKYTTDEKTGEMLGFDSGTRLNGMWLLNGKIGDDGKFQVAERDDVCRYTSLTELQTYGIKNQTEVCEMCSDSWGYFITGYVPIYTVEGHFVGLLGIDMDPDQYQSDAQKMIFIVFAAFAITFLTMIGLFLFFYFNYIKAKEGQLYFEFYSRMSHDMRTPMNGILGMALLSKEEKNPDVLHHNFEMVEEAGQYMLGLINDTLDIQKLDAGKLKLDPKVKNTRELVDALMGMMHPVAEKKKIDLEMINIGIDFDSYLRIDVLRVQQIFMNIASNAIKFTPEGGMITFTMEKLSEEGDIIHCKFKMSDTGIGMSEEFIHNHLFTPFEQEQNSVTTQYGGSGLGLAIVKNLITLMGGTIEAESKPGKGTCFIIYLDFERVDRETAEKEISVVPDEKNATYEVLQGRQILLCEDHPLNAEIAVKLLEKKGCNVVVAENGKEGIETFINSPEGTFDAILMDIRMPVMDGLTATRNIRKMGRKDAEAIPIIAMTANAYEDDIRNCMNAGMNGHISKPIEPDVFYRTLIKVFE